MPPGTLPIAEDLAFQRRQWRFERIGAVCLALLLVAAALGLFGPGLWNRTSRAAERGALVVDYPRFARLQAPFRVRVELAPDALRAGDVRLWLAAEYLDAVTIERMTPEPESEELGASGVVYTFAAGEAPERGVVVLDVEARRPGRVRGRIGTSAEDALELSHFVYP